MCDNNIPSINNYQYLSSYSPPTEFLSFNRFLKIKSGTSFNLINFQK